MRNGNANKRDLINSLISLSFLSYLWGMETWWRQILHFWVGRFSSYPTYEEWKHTLWNFINLYWIYVLILPMRNGNYPSRINFPRCSFVLILPYEEWKHGRDSVFRAWKELRSYPTYEEWKLILLFVFVKIFLGSYPTYEEWKLSLMLTLNLYIR